MSEQAAEDATPKPTEVDPTVARARALYRQGVGLVKKTQWGDALTAFEKSHGARPHSQTTFNIGLCERAMSAYTRARATFQRALAEHERGGGEPSASVQAEARGYVDREGKPAAVRSRPVPKPNPTPKPATAAEPTAEPKPPATSTGRGKGEVVEDPPF